MQKKNLMLIAAVAAVVVVGVAAHSALVSGASGGADSFATADQNGDGSLDKAEFASFVKAARLGTSSSPTANAKKGERICPHSGKVCEHSGAGAAGGCGGSCEGGAGGCGGSCAGGAGGCGGSCAGGASESEAVAKEPVVEPVVESDSQEAK